MNAAAMRAIMRKDLAVAGRARAVVAPLVIVPVILLVGIPLMVTLLPDVAASTGTLGELEALMRNMPASVRAEMAAYDERQAWVVLALVYFMAPLYLLIPTMVTSVIAADSFAGERERGTLEPLLHTPTTDRELFLAKAAAPWLAGVAVAFGSFLLYAVVVNAAGWRVMGALFFPTAAWLALVLWVAPAVAALGLGTMVLVSSRVRGFQEAYQLGGAVVVPIVGLVIGQSTGALVFDLPLVLALGAVAWAIAGALLWVGARSLSRSRLLERM